MQSEIVEKSSTSPSHKWFGLSVQAMVIMVGKTCACPSSALAEVLNSEATMLRRILVKLSKANLLETKEGRNGGYQLSKPPENITLADIYLALKVGEPLSNGMLDTTGVHAFGQEMKQAFEEITDDVERKTIEVLQQTTVKQLADRINPEQKIMIQS